MSLCIWETERTASPIRGGVAGLVLPWQLSDQDARIREYLSSAVVLGRARSRAAGGRLDYAAFTREYSREADAALDSEYRFPATSLGRLKTCGLLVEATVNRRESVFIPAELGLSSLATDSAEQAP
ncbi:MAG: hypothetical protein JXR37_18875 [Kiritimatiellae bacterium]|nr:hypothetical protein [Kiritimatiellia bacterium]